MRTIIAGSRGATKKQVEIAMTLCPFSAEITYVLSGMADGADEYGEEWALRVDVEVDYFPAKWDLYGATRAGKIRNTQMVMDAEALIAVWDGESPGTADVITKARVEGLKVFIYRTDNQSTKQYNF